MFLLSFYSDLNNFNNLNPQKESIKERNVSAYDNASELYNEYLQIYFDQYITLTGARKKIWVINIILLIYFLKHNYDSWFQNKESYDTTSRKSDKEESTDLSDMLPLGGDEEVKEGKGLTRLPILLAQMKAGNNSYKLNNEIRQILHLL